MKIANEYELLSMMTNALPTARRALVLAPHPDDEIFGCGGTLCLLREAGTEVFLLVLTDGERAGDNTGGELATIRQGESIAAARVLGLSAPLFWQEPDRGLSYGEVLIARLSEAIVKTEADLVFLPAPTELHPDHQALALAGAEALRRLGGGRQAVFYEINLPLPSPNLVIDITTVFEQKAAAMACFPSQLAEQPYDRRIEGLNRFRSYFLGPQAVAAEAFVLLDAASIQPGLASLFEGPLAHRRRLGVAVSGEDIPLVSVLIRSMDRPTLNRTLDSLALQTWPNVEVVLVNAKGGEHTPVDDHCGRFPLRLVNEGGAPLHRSRAANIGLAACRGTYIGFLDDDDTIDPDHLHNLVMALQGTPKPAVAYAGVRGVALDKKECRIIRTFKEPEVGFFRLLLGNVLPIHAVLFPALLLGQGVAVDETLDLYEDWDFWLQIAQKAPFVFVDQISASYYLGGTSAISPLDPDYNLALQASLRLYEKWQGLVGPEVLQGMGSVFLQAVAEREATIAGLRQTITEQNGHLAALVQKEKTEREATIAGLRQTITEQNGHLAALVQKETEREGIIQEVFASTSWRVTRPLRWCGHQVKRFRHVWKILPRLLQRGDGLFRTLRKGVTVFRREGLAGVRQRIRAAQDDRACLPGGRGCDRNDYREWVRRYDTITDEARAMILARIDKLVAKPFISVLMPTYNPKPEWLVEAIESVRGQLYPYWQLCIADDASTDPAVRAILERYAAEDARIRVVFRERNGHISAASNSALELATGEWLALLDHDDLLTEHALFWVAEAINRVPDARLIYSDEDKIDGIGQRFAPYFKCDWNEDLFYSHNMFSHLGVYATDLVREIGGFREGLEGSQDYDLALRCLERLEAGRIHHIPRVLYHWRLHAESTAQSSDAKPYALLAGERALNEHFARIGSGARAELLDFGMYRVRHPLPNPLPLVSLIIPTKNGLTLLRQCVESILRKTTYPNYEILLVDNGSDDPATLGYLEELALRPRVRVVRDGRPFNYSAMNNGAVRLAGGSIIGLINNDVEVIAPEWLSEMVSQAVRPGIGAVGARLWYPNDTCQHGGVILGLGGVASHAHKHLPMGQHGYFGRASLIQAMSAVTGACLVIRKEIYEQVGGLDEENLRVAFNDIDFCLRVREAGYRNLWTPYADLYHHESATRGFENTPEKQSRFGQEVAYMLAQWGERLLTDPAYNPNLTLKHEDFSLAWPPRVEQVSGPARLGRVDKALYMVDRQGLGLEIGPSHNPIAPKKEGFNVRIMDHAGREELIAKYRGHEVNLENIEEVDYVWQGEPLSELVGTDRYDWIVASHVIEHVPDLVSFLRQCEAALKADGVLSLVIPDRRYCFDYFSPCSTTGNVLDAWSGKRVQPSGGQVFDHIASAAKRSGCIAWQADDKGGADELIHTLDQATAQWALSGSADTYIDVHCWRFTPAAFRLILSDLRAMNLVGLDIKSEFDTTGCEFYISLVKKGQNMPQAGRLARLQSKIREEA